jgi:hypothetical protein
MVKHPVQGPAFVVWTSVTVGLGSQLSVAVTFAGAEMLLHSFVASGGVPPKTGAVLSVTVMTWFEMVMLPLPSVAFQVRVKV